jgi:hypothetical protein
VRFAVTGSLASSLRSVPRLTRDIDLVADLDPSRLTGLAAALRPEFYADSDMMRDALLRRKFDLFPAVSEFEESELARSTEVEAAPFGGATIRFPGPSRAAGLRIPSGVGLPAGSCRSAGREQLRVDSVKMTSLFY